MHPPYTKVRNSVFAALHKLIKVTLLSRFDQFELSDQIENMVLHLTRIPLFVGQSVMFFAPSKIEDVVSYYLCPMVSLKRIVSHSKPTAIFRMIKMNHIIKSHKTAFRQGRAPDMGWTLVRSKPCWDLMLSKSSCNIVELQFHIYVQ